MTIAVSGSTEVSTLPSSPDVPVANNAGSVKDIVESHHPRTAIFDDLIVTEDLGTDLLTDSERAVYEQGVDTLTSLLRHADEDEMEVLSNPEIVSTIIGTQPLIKLTSAHEAEVLLRVFDKAGIDFDQMYGMFSWDRIISGVDDTLVQVPALLNEVAARQILTHIDPRVAELGLRMPIGDVNNADLIRYIVDNINNEPTGHLTYGVLSGFPIEDCLRFIARQNDEGSWSLPEARTVDNIDAFISQLRAGPQPQDLRAEPHEDLRTRAERIRSQRKLVARRLTSPVKDDVYGSSVSAYGLRWRSSSPPSEGSQLLGKKLLQIDREFSLTDLVNSARSKYGLVPAFPRYEFLGGNQSKLSNAREIISQIAGIFKRKGA